MEFSPQQLVQLVERASTLAERLGPAFQPCPADGHEPLIKSRLEQWHKTAAQGKADKFAQRLAWDGLNIGQVSQRLGPVQWTATQPLPAWMVTLQMALTLAASQNDQPSRLVDPADPLPFEELLLPFVSLAHQKLINQAGSAYALLSEEAHTSLERSLLARLATACAQAITLEFSLFRLQKQPTSLQPWLQSAGAASQTLYHNFIGEMLGGQLVMLFQKYAVLGRLAATITDFWVEATLEFLQRLASDLPQLGETFGASAALGQVAAVQPALSDPHHRGRTVIALQFASGLKVVYKPRNLGLEVVYFQLLAWLNEQDHTLLPFKLLTILSQPTHGWVEYVTPSPCQNVLEARRYYRRAGMLLALLYTLNATDCHFQNIIACGDQPLIIDVDMLITPAVNWLPNQTLGLEAQMLATRQLTASVLYTGMVPRWEVGAGQSIYDVSGLGAVGEQDMQELIPVWRNINRDDMAVAYVPGKIESYTNAPLPVELDLSAADCDEELVLGFQQMYICLINHRAALLDSAPLAVLAEQYPRFMLRNTRGYFQVLQKSLHPKFLRDAAERTIQLDILSRWMLTFDQSPAYWPLLAHEQQALAQLDIPYFAVPATHTSFSPAPGQTIERLFSQSSYERVINRLNALNEADLARQVEIIQASAYARLTKDPHRETILAETTDFQPTTFSPSSSFFVAQAVEIAAELRRRAISSEDGTSLVWLGLDYLHEVQRYQYQLLRFGFYGGNGGIALFLAALARITGDDSWRSTALSTLQPMRYGLSDLISAKPGPNTLKILQAATLGGAQGLGSLFYVLAQTGHLLDEPALLLEARQLAAFITPELVASDTRFDVLLGTAGTILGLLALHRRTGDPAILTAAHLCGQHLLANRTTIPTGQRLWPTLQGKASIGFAHGTAGIAYALLQLAQAGSSEDTPALREAAKEAIAYEQRLLHGNYPEGQTGLESPAFGLGWCHGAAGIGLARLGGLVGLDTPSVRQDIEVALQISQQASLAGLDHLCCGNFGRIELLLTAGHVLGRPEWVETAQQQVVWLLDRAKQTGSFHLFSNLSRPLYHPSLFRGVSGIGYQLLRLAQPDSLPSVLLWH